MTKSVDEETKYDILDEKPKFHPDFCCPCEAMYCEPSIEDQERLCETLRRIFPEEQITGD